MHVAFYVDPSVKFHECVVSTVLFAQTVAKPFSVCNEKLIPANLQAVQGPSLPLVGSPPSQIFTHQIASDTQLEGWARHHLRFMGVLKEVESVV